MFLMFVAVLSASCPVYGGNDAQDNRFYVLMNEALEAQRLAATDLSAKRTNLEAFALLIMKSAASRGVSNNVRLLVEASATEACAKYLEAIPKSSTDVPKYVGPPEIRMIIFILQDATQLLTTLPIPEATLNVSPPLWGPENGRITAGEDGPMAAGMEPSGIKNPAARAEYERRIEVNRIAVEELNSRADIERSMDGFQMYLKYVITNLSSNENYEVIRQIVLNSKLADSVKTNLLEKFDMKTAR